MKTVKLIITGTVQGVFYRHSTWEMAKQLGLTGTVRNAPDKTVEIVAQGSESSLKKLITFCKDNPGNSKVDEVQESWEDTKETYTDFVIC